MHDDGLGFADVLIVGGGTAGCALAARLADNTDRTVVLLEAGRDYGTHDQLPAPLRRGYSASSSLPGDEHAWSYLAELSDDVTYPATRGRVLGGSSAVNGGQFTRGKREDFDHWAALGNDRWSFDEVLPFQVKLENDLDLGHVAGHGSAGPVPVRRAAQDELTPVASSFVSACLDRGYPFDPDMNGPQSLGVGLTPHNVVGGQRQSTAMTYLAPAERRRRPNLRVISGVTVRRVLFYGRRATGVTACIDGRVQDLHANEVILCAGGINSPHLLLLSGIGPAAGLRHLGVPVVQDLPGVGQGFMDHPAVHVTYRADRYRPTAGDLTASQVCLNFTSRLGQGPDDLRIFPTTYSKGGMLFGMRGQSVRDRLAAALSPVRHPARTWRHLKDTTPAALVHDIRHRGDLSFYCGLDLAESRGSLTLRSADPSQPPRLRHRYLTEERDRARLRECVHLAVDILNSPGFRDLGTSVTGPSRTDLTSPTATDEWIRQHISTAFHTASTCRMGPSTDPMSVVDQHGRVHGIEGLRVADVSIMPTLVRRGPSATAVLIGERIAALIEEEG